MVLEQQKVWSEERADGIDGQTDARTTNKLYLSDLVWDNKIENCLSYWEIEILIL